MRGRGHVAPISATLFNPQFGELVSTDQGGQVRGGGGVGGGGVGVGAGEGWGGWGRGGGRAWVTCGWVGGGMHATDKQSGTNSVIYNRDLQRSGGWPAATGRHDHALCPLPPPSHHHHSAALLLRRQVCVWHITSGKLRSRFAATTDGQRISAATFDRRYRRLITGEWGRVTPRDKHTVKQWGLFDGAPSSMHVSSKNATTCLHHCPHNKHPPHTAHLVPCRCMHAGAEGGVLRVWNYSSGAPLGALTGGLTGPRQEITGVVSASASHRPIFVVTGWDRLVRRRDSAGEHGQHQSGRAGIVCLVGEVCRGWVAASWHRRWQYPGCSLVDGGDLNRCLFDSGLCCCGTIHFLVSMRTQCPTLPCKYPRPITHTPAPPPPSPRPVPPLPPRCPFTPTQARRCARCCVPVQGPPVTCCVVPSCTATPPWPQAAMMVRGWCLQWHMPASACWPVCSRVVRPQVVAAHGTVGKPAHTDTLRAQPVLSLLTVLPPTPPATPPLSPSPPKLCPGAPPPGDIWTWNTESGAARRRLVVPELSGRPENERPIERLAFMHGPLR